MPRLSRAGNGAMGRRAPVLLWVSVVLALVLAAVAQARLVRPDAEHRETLYVFGTLVELVIRDPSASHAASAARDVGALLQQLHREWHAWRPGTLGRVNAALAAGQDAQSDAQLAALLAQGKRLACESGGLFEPAMGRLIALWGFHQDTPPEGTVLDPARLEALMEQRPSMMDVSIGERTISTTNPAVQLDLGGFAKGAALDLALAQLRAQGIEHAVLNAGGDVHVLGHYGPRGWRVAIRDPFVWGAVAAVELTSGEGLYTSGNYERFFEHQGRRFAHILDPRTGAPVQEIVSASVIHTNGARADAAATALSVAGPALWPQVAADMGITEALLITDAGEMMATPAMAARLTHLTPETAQALQVVDVPSARTDLCGDVPVL